MDRLADERGNHTLRLTTRQSIQFHGVIKTNLRPALRQIDRVLLDTIAACGDVNRNVMCTPNEFAGPVYAQAERTARDISTASAAAHRRLARDFHRWREGDRPIRKPSRSMARPICRGNSRSPSRCRRRTMWTCSRMICPTSPSSRRSEVIGYNVVVGGGMGATHGDAETYPRVGDVIGFCKCNDAVAVAEAVVTTQRDYGNRSNRRRARLKYTIEDRGLDWFVERGQ